MNRKRHNAPTSLDGEIRSGLSRSLSAFLSRYPAEHTERLFEKVAQESEKPTGTESAAGLRNSMALLERAAREMGDDCFGIAFAEQMPLKDFGILGYLMFHSPNLGSALDNAGRYFAAQQTLGQIALCRGPRRSWLTYHVDGPALGPSGQDIELVLFLLVRFCRQATGRPDWSPVQVGFAHGGPAVAERHERFFGAPVRFERPENALAISTADLDLPLPMADSGLLSILLRQADALMPKAPAPGSYAATVRRLLIESLRSGKASIEDVAEMLETTPRSLQRQLQDSGMTFRELLTRTRMELAMRHLMDPELSINETASILGYAHPTAFSRAFQQFTGQSPGAFRRSRD